MLPLRSLFASLLLASSAQAEVYLDTWLMPVLPTQEDTFVAVEHATLWPSSPHVFTWIAGERDADSRLLSANYSNVWDAGTQLMKFSFQWDFDLDYQVNPIFQKCPSRIVMDLSDGQANPKSDTDWYDWNPSTRTLFHRSSSEKLKSPTCAWADSIILDSRNRVVSQSSCGIVNDAYPDTLPHRQFVRYWYEDSSSYPRSASSRIPDLNWLDTLSVVGSIQRPYAAEFVHTAPGESWKSVDSLEWNARGQLVRQTTRKGYRTSVYTSEYDGSRLLRYSARYWQGDSLVDSLLDVYSYTLGGTGISRRAGARQFARIVSANGLAHLQLDLPAPDRVRVERISLDGKRLAILADKNLPAGRSFLPISAKAGELVRLRIGGTSRTLVVPGVR